MNIELLKNRSQPPGGWSYWCPVGEMDFPGGFAFDVQVSKIRQYRAANPNLNLPSDLGSVRNELLRFTFARLRKRLGAEEALKWFSVTGTDDAEIDEIIKKNSTTLPPKSDTDQDARHAGVIETAGHLIEGARILSDMFGEGRGPVQPSVSFLRAGVCAECKKNKPGNWLARLAGAVGPFIKEQMALKKQMNLDTPHDSRLTSCEVCDCFLPLLVWTPIETIAERTRAETLQKYPSHCWKKREINKLMYGDN